MFIRAYIGDITKPQKGVVAVVNAAKMTLMGGGGVDGAIHHAAGDDLHTACKALPVLDTVDLGNHGELEIRCPTGDAVITPAFDIDCDFIIHTVGPVYTDDSKRAPHWLKSCYQRCMEVAEVAGASRIAFPAIGTGIYGYPLEAACIVAAKTVMENAHLQVAVDFVCYDEEAFLIYQRCIDAARAGWSDFWNVEPS
jgi:O-acetyl-ADP-ribose deacetylase (regulator of RNase III)